VQGPEIALQGAVILLGGFIIFLILALLLTSLVITTTLHKKGSEITVCGMICWGIFGIQFCWDRGCGILYFRSLDRVLWSKKLPRHGTIPVLAVIRKPTRRGEIAWRSLLPGTLQALGYLARHLRIRTVSAEMVLGFPSAPTTGMVYGYVHAVKGILSPLSCISLQMTPDFDRTICNGRFFCSFEVRYPLILGFRLLRIGMRRPFRDVWFPRGGRS
jgi:hypothetical protein